jgi:cytochrome c oxidase subunit 3
MGFAHPENTFTPNTARCRFLSSVLGQFYKEYYGSFVYSVGWYCLWKQCFLRYICLVCLFTVCSVCARFSSRIQVSENLTFRHAVSRFLLVSVNRETLLLCRGKSFVPMYCIWQPSNVFTKAHEKHPFHLVDPSPWPFLTALAALGLVTSAVLWFHGITRGLYVLHDPSRHYPLHCAGKYVSCPFALESFSLSYFIYRWFSDIMTESVYQGHHTRRVVRGLQYGLLLFIAAETMFFFAFFFALFYCALYPSIWVGGVWPPKGILTANPWMTMGTSFLLYASGSCFTLTQIAIVCGDRRAALLGMLWTLQIGLLFCYMQSFEYAHSLFHINDSVFGSIYYLIVGFHTAHVIVGLVMVAVCAVRLLPAVNTFTRQHHFLFTATLWYWHFVDGVWMFVGVFLQYWGSLGAWEDAVVFLLACPIGVCGWQ